MRTRQSMVRTPLSAKMTRIALLWMQWAAIVVFLGGFLPIKEPVKGTASPDTDVPKDVQSEWLRRKVGQVVVVVIDALRADFVMPESLVKNKFSREGVSTSPRRRRPKIPSLHELIEDESELVNPFVARANTPTVTLPRIKALMSGTIPGFIDVVLNFGSSKFEGDNLIEQWKVAGRNITMFGDDTWLKLFPEHFVRSEGTTSFFVSDYTEVDLNVSRHLDQEMLVNRDWDVSILHYLGLDHIGHLTGPEGSAVAPKLVEMDQVIQFIKRELLETRERWRNNLPPLMIVLGDHGMADAGGHGGSSPAEVLTPMIFMSPKELKLTSKSLMIKQYDLVPTLAWLTGVPIPRNSLGSLIFKEPGDVCENYNRFQIAKCVQGKDHSITWMPEL